MRVNDRVLLALSDDENRVTLDGIFFDKNGQEILRIEQNIWKGSTKNWDIQLRGRTLTLRNGPADISLSIEITNDRELKINHLNFHIPGFLIQTLKNGRLRISQPGGPFMDNLEATTKGPIVVTDGRFVVHGSSTISAGTTFGSSELKQTIKVTKPQIVKIGRNEACYCGSGKKYKKCCQP